MVAQRIDGKALAKSVRGQVKLRAQEFFATYARRPRLEVVLVGEDPASQVYVRSKERAAKRAEIDGSVHRLSADSSMDQVLQTVRALNEDGGVDGILVQLPLPDHLDDKVVIDAIDPEKDVDGLHPTNAGLLTLGRKGLRPCTPSGVIKLIEHTGTDLSGKRALVIGRSVLVGKPLAWLLLEKNATVTVAHSRTVDLKARCREADVLIAAVGRPNMVKADWVKPGAVVIDVGINRLDDGSLAGDVDFEEASTAAAFITPVPGGVGPMTIAMLLGNTVDAALARESAKLESTDSN